MAAVDIGYDGVVIFDLNVTLLIKAEGPPDISLRLVIGLRRAVLDSFAKIHSRHFGNQTGITFCHRIVMCVRHQQAVCTATFQQLAEFLHTNVAITRMCLSPSEVVLLLLLADASCC